MIITYSSPVGNVTVEGTPEEIAQLLIELLPTNWIPDVADGILGMVPLLRKRIHADRTD